MIDWKTGNLVVNTESEQITQLLEPIEESKTLPKNLSELSSITQSTLIQNSLSGFIEKDAAIGKIEIEGFALSIKGLSTDYEQRIDFVLGEWRLLLNLIKLYNEPLKVMIGNYMSSSEEQISKRKLVKVLNKYVKHAEGKLKTKTQEFGDYLQQKATSKIVRKMDQGKAEGKRYLFEIFLPRVSVSYLHHNIQRNMTSDDVEHLCNTNFQNWKLFVIRTMFRMEFNIHDELPKKFSDRYLLEVDKKKRKKQKKGPKEKKQSSESTLKKDSSDKSRSDDTKSVGATTEEDAESVSNKKNIVLKKAEREQVQKAQKNIQFWFD